MCIGDVEDPGETRFAGARYVWLQQKFVFLGGNASSVHAKDGNLEKVFLESQDKIGGLAIDGNDLYVMRAGAPGAIVHIDLATGATQPFFEGNLDNTIFSIALAVDATHVYWLRDPAQSGQLEIWKRARCGGAAVRIGKHANAYRLGVLEDRLFIGAEDGLFSIAK